MLTQHRYLPTSHSVVVVGFLPRHRLSSDGSLSYRLLPRSSRPPSAGSLVASSLLSAAAPSSGNHLALDLFHRVTSAWPQHSVAYPPNLDHKLPRGPSDIAFLRLSHRLAARKNCQVSFLQVVSTHTSCASPPYLRPAPFCWSTSEVLSAPPVDGSCALHA